MSVRSLVASIPGARQLNRRLVALVSKAKSAVRPPRKADADSPESLQIRFDLWGLALRNRWSKRPIVDANTPVVVCTTTHGNRIRTIATAIESVGRGTARPGRYILWLDDPTLAIPASIKRLQKRGLEVVVVDPGLKVHTKYYPYVQSVEVHTLPLASAEDDIVYPPNWLADLLEKHREEPDCVVTFRAHTIGFEEDRVAPYTSWRPTVSAEPSFRHFGTTVSGQLYPPSFVNFVRSQGDAFLALTPTNDDVWLHCLSVRAGVRTIQVTRDQQHFPFVPGTQAHGLFWTNVVGGQNDVQIQRTYLPSEIDRMKAEPHDS